MKIYSCRECSREYSADRQYYIDNYGNCTKCVDNVIGTAQPIISKISNDTVSTLRELNWWFKDNNYPREI